MDEFLNRRRKSKWMAVIFGLFFILGVAMLAFGIWFVIAF